MSPPDHAVSMTQTADTATPSAQRPALRLRLVLGADIAIGAGKADLLAGIEAAGSIAAAGRAMGMSYKKAWHLIDTMNRCFRDPLVEAARGGHGRGGAQLTPTGREVLSLFRRIEAEAGAATARDVAAIGRLVANPDPPGAGS
jgi:molybdate transport system regulatory protein